MGLGEFSLSTYVGAAMWAARETQDALSPWRVAVRSGCSLGCEWARAVAGGRWPEARGLGGLGGSLHPRGSELPAPHAQCQRGPLPGSLPHALPDPGSWMGARTQAQSGAGTSERVPERVWAFYVVPSARHSREKSCVSPEQPGFGFLPWR